MKRPSKILLPTEPPMSLADAERQLREHAPKHPLKLAMVTLLWHTYSEDVPVIIDTQFPENVRTHAGGRIELALELMGTLQEPPQS